MSRKIHKLPIASRMEQGPFRGNCGFGEASSHLPHNRETWTLHFPVWSLKLLRPNPFGAIIQTTFQGAKTSPHQAACKTPRYHIGDARADNPP